MKNNANNAVLSTTIASLSQSSLAQWMHKPLQVEAFQPLSREEANAR